MTLEQNPKNKQVVPPDNNADHSGRSAANRGRAEQIRAVSQVTLIGLAVNIALSLFKISAGILGNSYAVLADGFHSVSDLLTDAALLVGVRFWTAAPDECHPYGHARIEYLISLFIALALLFTALGLVWGSVSAFLEGEPARTEKIAVIAALVSIILKEILYRWTIRQSWKYNSSALNANAWHHRSDALSSIPALFAAGLSMLDPELKIADLVGAVVIAVFIAWAAWKIARPALNALIDGSPGRELRARIYAAATQINGVRDVHAMRTRFLGQGVEVSLHVMVEGDLSVEAGHRIAHEVEDALRALGPEIGHVIIHIEPWFAPKEQ